MKRRVARLLEGGVPAVQILPVTFTRIAAEDLHRELVNMAVAGCDALEGRTLHSLAMRVLMRNHVLAATGRTPRPLNDFEVKPLEADLADGHGGVREVRKRIKAYEAAWARLQHDVPGALRAEDIAFEHDLLPWLRFHGAMLIGEVIPQLHQYLALNPAAPERAEFGHILVDEYQDLNKAEQAVITLLSTAASVCVIGDDDQSIYSFKHAHPEGIREWIGTNLAADDLTLGDCRRCPTRVVQMANALIGHNHNRPTPRVLLPVAANGAGDVRIVQYQTLHAEIAGVVAAISEMIAAGTPPGDILVLAQRGVIGTPIYEGLVAAGVPARSYYAEAELDAEDAQRRFALLKLFVDRYDRVALRWLLGQGSNNWLAASYRRLRSHCEATAVEPWTTLEALSDGVLRVPHTRPLVERFEQISGEIEALEAAYAGANLQAVIDVLFPAGMAEVRDLRNLAAAALAVSGAGDRVAFLGELTSAIAKPEIPSDVEDVRIMSLHKSKGLNAPVAIIAGCIEGLLPKQPDRALPIVDQVAQLEEQRRLFFVGITRVKAIPAEGKPGTLLLTYSMRMPLADAMTAGISPAHSAYGHAQLLASRYIGEMAPAAPAPTPG
jgi:superfamily I DNA/RNA helicase